MSIKADTKYSGTVTAGSHLYAAQVGTLGYKVMLECADGPTSFEIWLTEKNRDRAVRYFEALGVGPEKLKDPSYIEHQLGLDIEGREVSFGTRDEDYNGRRSVRVAWIGRKVESDLARRAARFFGGAKESSEASAHDAGIAEPDSASADIPF